MGIMPVNRDKKWQEVFRRYGMSGGDRPTTEKPQKAETSENPLKEATRSVLPEQLLPEGMSPRRKRK